MSLRKNFVLVSVVAVAVFGALQTRAIANPVPVDFWGLHDATVSSGSTCVDSGSNGYNATYKTASGTLTSVTGYAGPFLTGGSLPWSGNAVLCNGNGLGGSSDPGGYAEYTYSTTTRAGMYVYPNSTIECFFNLGGTNTAENDIYTESAAYSVVGSNGPYFGFGYRNGGVYINAGTLWGAGNLCFSTYAPVANQWYYAAATISTNSATYTTTMNVYVYNESANGSLSGWYSGTSATGPSGANTPATITDVGSISTPEWSTGTSSQGTIGSGRNDGTRNEFQGDVEDLAIYNTVLSVSQMQADAGITPEPSTLVLLAAGLAGLLCYAWRKRR